MAAGLTKTQLTRHLAEKIGTNNKTAAAFLENLADTAIKETKKNGVFVVPGLGRLVKAHRKARMGRNPQTGERSRKGPRPRKLTRKKGRRYVGPFSYILRALT
jgi:DNA-binding protein HU-beta